MNYRDRIFNRAADASKESRRLCAEIAAEADAEIERLRKALEFAEYLANGAERLLGAINAHGALTLRREDSDDVDDDTMHDAYAEIVEYQTGLRSDIYEFRKRAAIDAAMGLERV